MVKDLQKKIDNIRDNYKEEKVQPALDALDFNEEGLNWCMARERSISKAVASIGMQWKRVIHYNSIAKDWGQAMLNLLALSNQVMYPSTEMPGQQLNMWHPVNAGI